MARETDGYTPGEVTRQIESLWDSHRRLEVKLEVNNKEIVALSAQMPYVVQLLEKIAASQAAQVPVCAVRGQRVDMMESRVSKVINTCDDTEERLTKLENTGKILSWLTGVATAILTLIGADKLSKYFQ